MGLVDKSTLPPDAHLWTHHSAGDFIDCYSCDSPLSAQEAARVAMQMPGWADALLRLRNKLVAPLGLRTDLAGPESTLFPITHEAPDELNLGLDDSHLNFRISIYRQEGRIYMATWVHPNKWLGRAYLAVVMPFHILISRNAVRQIAQASQPRAA